MPFVLLAIFSISYFHNELGDKDSGLAKKILIKTFGSFSVLLLLDAVRLEYKQLMSMESKLDYFKEIFNLIDITGILLTFTIILSTLFEQAWLDEQNLRIMAAFSSCSLMIKFYDWLRLFESTSFFILLIERTLNDILFFMILFTVAILAFGLPMSMLDLNRAEGSELIQSSYGFWLFDLILNQYLLSLGEFASLESIGDNP